LRGTGASRPTSRPMQFFIMFQRLTGLSGLKGILLRSSSCAQQPPPPMSRKPWRGPRKTSSTRSFKSVGAKQTDLRFAAPDRRPGVQGCGSAAIVRVEEFILRGLGLSLAVTEEDNPSASTTVRCRRQPSPRHLQLICAGRRPGQHLRHAPRFALKQLVVACQRFLSTAMCTA
jgi:hypothetical protein